MTHQPTRIEHRIRSLLPLIVYPLIAVVITFPLIMQVSTHIAGAEYTDSFEFARLGWWARYAPSAGLNPFYQRLLAYPDGFFSGVQIAQPLIYLPIAVLNLFMNPVAAFNVWFLIVITLNGIAAYVLCRDVLNGSTLPALIGGAIFMAYPTMQGHFVAGHINILSNYALPIFLLAVWRILNGRGGIRIAVIGAVSLWILTLGNYTAAVYALLPIGLFGGMTLLIRKHVFTRAMIRDFAVIGALAVALITPFYMPLAAEVLSERESAFLQETGIVAFSSEPLALIAPSPFTPWTRNLVPYSDEVLGTNAIEGTAYIGIAVAILCAFALRSTHEHRRVIGFWLVIACGCVVFSFGPLLKVGNQPVMYAVEQYESYITLPWAALQPLPVISVSRTPGRFNITAGLMIAVMAAIGLHVLIRRVRIATIRVGLVALIGAFILAEYQLFSPFPTTPPNAPAVFEAIAARDDVRAVFDVPTGDVLAQKFALMNQTVHRKPMITGHVSRTTPVSRGKLAVLEAAVFGDMPDSEARYVLDAAGADVIVVHWRTVTDREGTTANLIRRFGEPLYTDTAISVFDVPHTDFGSSPVSTSAGQTIHLYMPDERQLRFYVVDEAERQIGQMNGMVSLSLNGKVIRRWNATTTPDPVISLPPGYHTLIVDAGILCCWGHAPNHYEARGVQLGSGMRLESSHFLALGAELFVDTVWRAENRFDKDYHYFVHVVDESGTIVAQIDTVPGENTYPTTEWDAPQSWIESAVIPIPESVDGTLKVFAGWYSYPDLVRLPIEDNAAANGLVYLGEVTLIRR